MKNLFGLIIAISFLLMSCGDDNSEIENGTLTPEEASAQINNIADQFDTDIVEMVESEGIQALEDLASLFLDFDSFESGRESNRNWIEAKLKLITQTFINGPLARVSTEEELFSFEDIKGIWEWNPSIEKFEKTAEADVFTLLFPTEGSETNNAELSITRLEFVSITESDDWGTYTDQYPTEIEGTLKVDGVTYVLLDVSIVYDEFGYPEQASALLDIVPYSFSFSFDATQSLTSTISASVSKNEEILFAADGMITFESAEKERITFIEGSVQYTNLRIAGTVDTTVDWSEELDINNYIILEVYVDNEKVGDIMFEEDIAYIVYLDGSKENLEEILEPIIERIEETIDELD